MSKTKGQLISEMEEDVSVSEMEDKMEKEKEEREQKEYEKEQELKEYYDRKLTIPFLYKPNFMVGMAFMFIPLFITGMIVAIAFYPFLIALGILIFLGYMQCRKEKWIENKLKKEYPGLFDTPCINKASLEVEDVSE